MKPYRPIGAAALGLAALVSATASAQTTLTLIHQYAPAATPQLEALLAPFEKAHDVKVELVRLTQGATPEKVVAMSAAGTAPDVVRLSSDQTVQLARAGLVLPLYGFITADKLDTRRWPDPIFHFSWFNEQGHIYALPAGLSMQVIFYDKDAFKARGVDLPPAKWGGWDWATFVADAKKMTYGENGQISHYGLFRFDGADGSPYMIGLWGQQWVTPDLKHFRGTDSGLLEAERHLIDLRLTDQVMPNVTQAPLTTGDGVLKGWASMEGIQNPVLPSFERSTLNWDVAPLPQGSTLASQAGLNQFVVPSGSKHAKLAWELVKYLTYDVDANRQLSDISGRIPALIANGPHFVERLNAQEAGFHAQVFTDATAYYWDMQVLDALNAAAVGKLINQALHNVLLGQKSLAGALAEVAPQADALLQGE